MYRRIRNYSNSIEDNEVIVEKKEKKKREPNVQYRINKKGEKRRILVSIPLISIILFVVLIHMLSVEIYSSFYQVDMNDVIRNFDVQLSTTVISKMNSEAFRYELENINELERDSTTGGAVVKKKKNVSSTNTNVNANFDYSVNFDDEVDELFGLTNSRKTKMASGEISSSQAQSGNSDGFNPNSPNTVTSEKISQNNYVTSTGEKYHIIANLNIPSLSIDYPILSDTSDELLKISLTKYWGADPNQIGNMVVLGHNYESKKFFSKLPEIEEGTSILITDLTGQTVEYEVYSTEIIDPYDNSCTSQLTAGKKEITLITCYNRDANRFVVKARAK